MRAESVDHDIHYESTEVDVAGLAATVQARVTNRTTPGLQLVIVNQQGVVHEYHTGFAELASKRPMQADTTLMA